MSMWPEGWVGHGLPTLLATLTAVGSVLGASERTALGRSDCKVRANCATHTHRQYADVRRFGQKVASKVSMST
jgi:hypothetical protein